MTSARRPPGSPEAAGREIPRENKQPGRGLNILVVDDQMNLARVTAVALRLLGCKVFTAATVAEALAVLDTEMIDALLLDENLGGESGLKFLAQLSARRHRALVIVFTAQREEEIAAEAIRCGAFACLFKPFTMDDLRERLNQVRQHLAQPPGAAKR